MAKCIVIKVHSTQVKHPLSVISGYNFQQYAFNVHAELQVIASRTAAHGYYTKLVCMEGQFGESKEVFECKSKRLSIHS